MICGLENMINMSVAMDFVQIFDFSINIPGSMANQFWL